MNRSLQNRSTRPNRDRAVPFARLSAARARLVVVRVEELNDATPAEILSIRIRAFRPTARGCLGCCGTHRWTRGFSLGHHDPPPLCFACGAWNAEGDSPIFMQGLQRTIR